MIELKNGARYKAYSWFTFLLGEGGTLGLAGKKTYRSCLAFCSRERLSPITDMAYRKDKSSYCSATHKS